jgi:hypothetical protein
VTLGDRRNLAQRGEARGGARSRVPGLLLGCIGGAVSASGARLPIPPAQSPRVQHGVDEIRAIHDLVLQEAANRLFNLVRPSDLVARLGADEFALLLPGCDAGATLALCQQIVARLPALPLLTIRFAEPELDRVAIATAVDLAFARRPAAIFDVIREPLSANGLAIVQGIEDGAVGVIITTRLLHSSGQWVESTMTLKPTKTDPQGVASAATYGRRIGLQALVGVAADVDDDGNEASKPSTKPAAASPVKAISVAQRDFNSWVKPYIDSGAITADNVKKLIAEHKNDYENTLATLKLALT